MMEYKGYVATVEYDDSIGMLHGSVINGGDYPIATCEAKDVDTLRREFRLSIDDYLTACKESGIEPGKPLASDSLRSALLRVPQQGRPVV